MFERCNYPFSQKWFVDDDEAYFIEIEHSWLFKVNLSDNRCELLETFSEDGFKRLSACHRTKNILWCFPDISDHGWIYNLENHDYHRFDISMGLIQKKSRLGIDMTWDVGGRHFAAAFPLAIIFEFDLQNSSFIVHKPNLDNDIDLWNEDDSECDEKNIYLISKVKNSVYRFDVIASSFECLDIIGIEGHLTNITKIEDSFALCDDFGNVYIWNGDANKCEKICSLEIHILHSTFVGNSYILIPERGKSIYQVFPDGKHEEIKVICRNCEKKEKSFDNLEDRFSMIYSRDNRYVGIYSYLRKNIIEYDAKIKEFNNQYCTMSDSAYEIINGHDQHVILDESFGWQRNFFWNEIMRN